MIRKREREVDFFLLASICDVLGSTKTLTGVGMEKWSRSRSEDAQYFN